MISTTSAVSSAEGGKSDVGDGSFTAQTNAKTSSLAHTITAAPPNSNLTRGDECLLQDAYCSLQGPGHSLDGLLDECILWDSSCSGDRSLATSRFYGSVTNALMKNTCFFDSSPDCSKRNPPGRISALNSVRDWMRSPQCLSEDPLIQQMENGNDANVVQEDLFLNQTCCNDCEVKADQVDVYYWSHPDANTSCLSIIGDGNSDLAVGASTDTDGVYWGCTSWSASQGQSGPGSAIIVKTATLTSVASMTFRSYLFNPWGDSPCEDLSTSLSSNTNASIHPRGISAPIYPRGHTLIAPNSSVSTVVLGNATL